MDLKLFEGMKKGKSGLDSCGPFFFFFKAQSLIIGLFLLIEDFH